MILTYISMYGQSGKSEYTPFQGFLKIIIYFWLYYQNRMSKKPQKNTKAPKPFTPEASINTEKIGVYAALALTGIFALIRYRLVNFPFERDEAAFAYMARQILDGIPLYTQAIDFKPPLLYATYALFIKLFGYSAQGVHTGLLLYISASMMMLYFFTKRLLTPFAGLVSVALLGVLSMSPTMLAQGAHATHFVNLPVLGAGLLLLKALEENRKANFFLSGILLGAAFLMKQPAMLFFGFAAAAFLFYRADQLRGSLLKTLTEGGLVIAGTLLPLLLTGLAMWLSGSLKEYIFWNFTYPKAYGSAIPLSEAGDMLRMMLPGVTSGYRLAWYFGLFGLAAAFLHPGLSRKRRLFITAFAVFSFLAVCPGFFFRSHYFIVMLPALALLCAAGADMLRARLKSFYGTGFVVLVPAALVAFMVIRPLSLYKGFFFKDSLIRSTRAIYGTNPFPEALQVARYIKENSLPGDKIAILGSEPEIFVYADRKSASKYIFTYPLVEAHQYASEMQKEMIREIEESKPEYFIIVNVNTSWVVFPGADMGIFKWMEPYSNTNYRLVGLVDMVSTNQTNYYWNQDASRRPESQNFMVVFRRNRT
jgi:hypothetical protein